jgi:hypothetical protein
MRDGSGHSAIECFMRRIIDYAGLFPPASLSMLDAVTNYATYSQSEYNWVLGSFIVPAARLVDFEEAIAGLPSVGTPFRWDLSVLLGADPRADMESIHRFDAKRANSNSPAEVAIKSVEVKASNPDEVRRLDGLFPYDLMVYVELPFSEGLQELVAAVRRALFCCGLKIRMGGETLDKFPAAEAVIEFLRLAVPTDLHIKATAGLHHPVRSMRRFTNRSDSPTGMMHGFLNLFLAAAFLKHGMDTAQVLDILKEESPSAFRFDEEEVSWRQHRLSGRSLFLARRNFAESFGSCSFTEPIDDLRALHIL